MQLFSVLMKSPDDKICLVLIKVNPFETELTKVITWEVAGVLQSLNGDPIIAESIIIAKLLEGTNNYSVIAQYGNQLIGLKVIRHLPSQQEIKMDKVKNFGNMIQARMLAGNSLKVRQDKGGEDAQFEDPFKLA